ncbi:MAG: hypothetical protein MHM6MM_003475 [Cercozoa sp. M6MM]
MDDAQRAAHVRYFSHFLSIVPQAYESVLDSQRMTAVMFATCALGLLKPEEKHAEVIEWIYAQQLPHRDDSSVGGFRAGPHVHGSACDTGHLAMTYCALCSLLVAGDDLSRVDVDSVKQAIRSLQRPCGGFAASPIFETDMRFVYCAAAICRILNVPVEEVMDVNAAVAFVKRAQSFEGGFGTNQHRESHGGSTFCAVASLVLLRRLDDALPEGSDERKTLCRWVLRRQGDGWCGRAGKPQDTCYSFWLGSTARLLGLEEYLQDDANLEFVLKCQSVKYGGFGKDQEALPDLMHAYLGLAGLSLMRQPEIKLPPLDEALNLPLSACPAHYLGSRAR